MYSDPIGYKPAAEMSADGAVIGALSGIIVPNVLSMIKILNVNSKAQSPLSIANPCGICTEMMWILDIILNGGRQ